MQKLMFSFLIVMFFSLKVEAQCEVSKQIGSHSNSWLAAFEEVYINEDLENGVNKYLMSLGLNKDFNSSIPDNLTLECRYITSSSFNYEGVQPNKISINFIDGTNLILQSLTVQTIPTDVRGFVVKSYLYEITPNIKIQLGRSGIKEIIFWDKKENRKTVAPAKEFLKNQIVCLDVFSRTNK